MGKKILLVEDDPAIRSVLEDLLRLEEYEVMTAEHGAEAKRLLVSGYRPDLVLLDLLMPIMDGRTFLQDSEVKLALGKTPIFVLTAGKVENLDVPVIRKPMSLDFMEKIKEAI